MSVILSGKLFIEPSGSPLGEHREHKAGEERGSNRNMEVRLGEKRLRKNKNLNEEARVGK